MSFTCMLWHDDVPHYRDSVSLAVPEDDGLMSTTCTIDELPAVVRDLIAPHLVERRADAGNDRERRDFTPKELVAKAVAEVGGLAHQAYAHMEAAPGFDPNAAPRPGEVMFGLLSQFTGDWGEAFDPEELTTTARVLDAVGAAMEEELLFVAHDGPPCADRAQRRRGRRRGC